MNYPGAVVLSCVAGLRGEIRADTGPRIRTEPATVASRVDTDHCAAYTYMAGQSGGERLLFNPAAILESLCLCLTFCVEVNEKDL